MIKIKRVGEFNLQLNELVHKNVRILPLINQRIRFFQNNSEDTRLRNHALTKRMKGKYAFSITDDIRIIYKYLGKNTVRFLAIGSHKEVYGRF